MTCQIGEQACDVSIILASLIRTIERRSSMPCRTELLFCRVNIFGNSTYGFQESVYVCFSGPPPSSIGEMKRICDVVLTLGGLLCKGKSQLIQGTPSLSNHVPYLLHSLKFSG